VQKKDPEFSPERKLPASDRRVAAVARCGHPGPIPQEKTARQLPLRFIVRSLHVMGRMQSPSQRKIESFFRIETVKQNRSAKIEIILSLPICFNLN